MMIEFTQAHVLGFMIGWFVHWWMTPPEDPDDD